MKKILFILGTRPEAIKLVPLIKIFKNDSDFEDRVITTAQHREMFDQILVLFDISPNTPDYGFNLMRPSQSLFYITAESLDGLKEIYRNG
jgi:UDP-N-acetylglucosamine 2-epimerase (non-hydrolysing)